MLQVVNRRSQTAMPSPRQNCGGQNDTETPFCSSASVFPCQYHSTLIFIVLMFTTYYHHNTPVFLCLQQRFYFTTDEQPVLLQRF